MRPRSADEASEPARMEPAHHPRGQEPQRHHRRRQLYETTQRLRPGEGQERRRRVELAEAGRVERELPAVLMPGAEQREERAPAEERDVGGAAVRDAMERAEDRDRHERRVPRQAVHAVHARLSRHDAGRTGADEARNQEDEGDRHAYVHRPAQRRAPLDDPEPAPDMLVREERPYERHEDGERDQRVEPLEETRPETRDQAAPHGQAREPHVGYREREPEERDRDRGRHAERLTRRPCRDKMVALPASEVPGRTAGGVLRHQQAPGLRALLDDAERARRDRRDGGPEARAPPRARRDRMAGPPRLAGRGAGAHGVHDAGRAARRAGDERRAPATRHPALSMPTALGHLQVLEVGDGVGAAYATKLLADLGADVVKIEPPGRGDATRRRGPFPGGVPHPEKSGLFLYLNA